MDGKGRFPPPHMRRPMPALRPEPVLRRPPAPAPFPHLPPPQVLEQKLAAQHVEMQRLATENQRLAATHGTLRQELAAAQHELQLLHAHIESAKSQKEQQRRNLNDKIAKLESELQSADHVKAELKQARDEAQTLVAARQELLSKVQNLNQDLQRAHTDLLQIPALMSEFEILKQDYHQCRITYDNEKKMYDDHLQQLQVMEQNYVNMTKEVEKLRAQLGHNSTSMDTRAVQSGNNGGEANVYANAHGDGYGILQGHGRGQHPHSAGAANTLPGAPPYGVVPGAQMGPTPPRSGYDADRVPGYDPYRAGQGYPQAGHHSHRGGNYDAYRGPSFPSQGVPPYDMSRSQMYNPQFRGAPVQLNQIPGVNNVGYPNTTPPPRPGGGGAGGR